MPVSGEREEGIPTKEKEVRDPPPIFQLHSASLNETGKDEGREREGEGEGEREGERERERERWAKVTPNKSRTISSYL